MKKVKSINEIIAVYYDREWDEYQVRVKDRPAATYYAGDKEDAFDTAHAMAELMVERPEAFAPQDLSVGEEFDVDEVIVYADQEEDVYVVWNQSATFNVWVLGRNVDCFTVYNVVSVDQAIAEANEWFVEHWGEVA